MTEFLKTITKALAIAAGIVFICIVGVEVSEVSYQLFGSELLSRLVTIVVVGPLAGLLMAIVLRFDRSKFQPPTEL
jgi:hypothetical protein